MLRELVTALDAISGPEGQLSVSIHPGPELVELQTVYDRARASIHMLAEPVVDRKRLRLILQRRVDNSYDCVTAKFETLDVDVPELERRLRRGSVSRGGPGYDVTELVGVEILEAT